MTNNTAREGKLMHLTIFYTTFQIWLISQINYLFLEGLYDKALGPVVLVTGSGI
jgi:hypothetical protein